MSDVDLTKATPGPWIAVGMGSEGYNIYTDDFEKPITEQRFRGAIAQVRGGEWKTLRANAHLIAAAPEILEALEETIKALEFLKEINLEMFEVLSIDPYGLLNDAKVALAKAKVEL